MHCRNDERYKEKVKEHWNTKSKNFDRDDKLSKKDQIYINGEISDSEGKYHHLFRDSRVPFKRYSCSEWKIKVLKSYIVVIR